MFELIKVSMAVVASVVDGECRPANILVHYDLCMPRKGRPVNEGCDPDVIPKPCSPDMEYPPVCSPVFDS